MIATFADFETELIFRDQRSRKRPPDIQQTARRKLRQLNRAMTICAFLVATASRS